ncbi:MAG: site-specific integrase [Planctomycetes bacterium]|nr:site-specific integrase [Planctomycetota bacterium]
MNGSLYKRGRTYYIDYRLNGKRYRESTNTTKRREAELILDCRKREIKEAKRPEIKEIQNACKLVELAHEYLKWTERQRVHVTKKIWVKQLVEAFGNLSVRDLNPRVIEQWQSVRLKFNKPSTVNRLTGCLKHMINKGVQWGMATEETLKQVRMVKPLEENNRRLRFLTIEECQTLVDCCAPHLRPIVVVALHTGMRRGEVLGLKWEQVDLNHGFILLSTSKNGERREIPLDDTLIDMFSEMPHSIESIHVFTDRDGNPYKGIKHSFSTALRKADIRDFRFHDLRHTFASHLVMGGVDLVSVKDLLGHKSLTMTLRYAHLAAGHKRRAVNTLDQLLQSGQEVGCDHDVTKTYQNSLQ